MWAKIDAAFVKIFSLRFFNDALVVAQFIETMELLRVQGPNSNI
jgi:hypothetical protein